MSTAEAKPTIGRPGKAPHDVDLNFGGPGVEWQVPAAPGAAARGSANALAVNPSHLLGAVVAGLTAAAIVRDGAFHPPTALAVGAASMVLIVLSLRTSRTDARTKFVAVSLGALALCWLVMASAHGTLSGFLPFGASTVAFLAGYLVMGALDRPSREASARVFVALGVAVSVTGLAAVVLRWYPLAMRWYPGGDNIPPTWRLASTLTYFNAAGLLLAMATLVAISLDATSWAARLGLYICAVGLIATQSRGAVVAFAVGILFVPLAQIRRAVLPLAAGFLVGVGVVAWSPDHRFLIIVPVVVGGGVLRVRRPSGVLQTYSGRVTAAIVVVAIGAGMAWLLTHPVLTHLGIPDHGDPRLTIWAAAIHQWRSSPLLGVGPDRLIRLHSPSSLLGTQAIFAHNEYLQLLTDGGLLGAGLLVTVAMAVVWSIRRRTALASCAVGALVAFAVAGAFDFDWHLPALALMGGWVTGLAKGDSP